MAKYQNKQKQNGGVVKQTALLMSLFGFIDSVSCSRRPLAADPLQAAGAGSPASRARRGRLAPPRDRYPETPRAQSSLPPGAESAGAGDSSRQLLAGNLASLAHAIHGVHAGIPLLMDFPLIGLFSQDAMSGLAELVHVFGGDQDQFIALQSSLSSVAHTPGVCPVDSGGPAARDSVSFGRSDVNSGPELLAQQAPSDLVTASASTVERRFDSMAERDSLGDLVARIDQRTVAIDALVIRLLTRVDHIEESNTRIGDQVARLGDLVARFCAQVNRIGDQVARFDNRINLVIAILNAIEAQVSPPIGGADAVLEEEEEEEDDVPVHAAAGVRPQNLDLNAQHVDLAILSIGGADAGLEEEEEDDVPVHAADAGLEEYDVPVHAAAGVRPQNLDLNAPQVDPAILSIGGADAELEEEEEEEDYVPVHAADAGLEEEGYVPVHAAAGVRIPQNLDLNAQRVDPAILFFMGAGGYL